MYGRTAFDEQKRGMQQEDRCLQERRFPLNLFNDLRRLATADQAVRRNELLALLREMDCPFMLLREHLADLRPENIVIRFQEEAPQRFVIGAHYDSVPGSTGANDNGAGVCVLLAWLRSALHHPPSFPLDVVFFDLEELGQIGSRAYLKRFASEDILAMINLDMCGVGDTLLVAPSLEMKQSELCHCLLAANHLGLRSSRMVEALPPGDDLPFADGGVPTLSVSMLPSDEIEPLEEAVNAWRQGQIPATMPKIAETFHNGCRDSIETIEVPTMQAVSHWLESILKQFESL